MTAENPLQRSFSEVSPVWAMALDKKFFQFISFVENSDAVKETERLVSIWVDWAEKIMAQFPPKEEFRNIFLLDRNDETKRHDTGATFPLNHDLAIPWPPDQPETKTIQAKLSRNPLSQGLECLEVKIENSKPSLYIRIDHQDSLVHRIRTDHFFGNKEIETEINLISDLYPAVTICQRSSHSLYCPNPTINNDPQVSREEFILHPDKSGVLAAKCWFIEWEGSGDELDIGPPDYTPIAFTEYEPVKAPSLILSGRPALPHQKTRAHFDPFGKLHI